VDLFRGLQGAKLQDILAQLLTPPDPASIEAAVLHLTRLGALAPADESLTPLGRHLVAMPMDADLGKALIYGCMLRCTGPLLTIAAAAAYGRPVWVSPGDKRAAAEAAKRAVAAAAYAQRSDHLAIVAAYNGWLSARAAGGRREAAEYCSKSFLSYQVWACCWVGRLEAGRELLIYGPAQRSCMHPAFPRAHLPCATPSPPPTRPVADQGSSGCCLQIKACLTPSPCCTPGTHSHTNMPPLPPPSPPPPPSFFPNQSQQALETIHASRLDYAATLTSLGFLPDWYTSHLKQEAVHGPAVNAVNAVNGQRLTRGGDDGGDQAPALDSYATEPGGPDEYSHNARVVKAALVAGFYPRILRVEAPPAKYAKVEGGAMRTEHEAR
jgi:hypothetical protein